MPVNTNGNRVNHLFVTENVYYLPGSSQAKRLSSFTQNNMSRGQHQRYGVAVTPMHTLFHPNVREQNMDHLIEECESKMRTVFR
jgi:hypothetical protein